MGFLFQQDLLRIAVSLLDLERARFVARPKCSRGAGARRSGQGWRASATRKVLDGSEHDGRLAVVGMTMSRGARVWCHEIRATSLYSVGPETRTMMQYAHRQRSSEAADPFSEAALEAIGTCGTPPPRTVNRRPAASLRTGPKLSCVLQRYLPSVCGTEGDALGHHAIADEVPQGDQELAGQGDDHFLREPRAFSVRASNHLARALSFWYWRKRQANWIIPAAPEHCRIGQALSPGVSFRSRRVNR